MNDLRCIGCGALIQTVDKNKHGYVKESVLNQDKDIYCERCFRLKNYSKIDNEAKDPDSYLKVIQKIAKTDSLVVSLVDVFDFSGTFISSIKRHTGQNDIILVGNKADVLPQSVKEDKIIRWMRHMANLEGFRVLDCLLVSAKSGKNIDALMDSIDKYKKGRDCYVVGCSNVGKSTLINTIIKKYTDCKRDIITTSMIPGTTLDFINIPYEENFIIDTPGLINESQMVNHVEASDLKTIMPKKEIKPTVFQLNPFQTVFLGGLAIFNFLSGEKTNFVFHFSNDLYLHRTKMENKDHILETQYNNLLKPCFKSVDYNSFVKSTFNLKDDKKYDIVISGLGFITVKGRVTLSIETMKGIGVYLREAII